MKTINLSMPVIGILRGVEADFFCQVMAISFAAGLQAIEITMNTEGAVEMVSENRALVPKGKLLGMGTIRNLEEARRAIDAGAMFLVAPNFDSSVIEYAVSQQVPIIAGALTPTEVYAAWSAGAAMIKVFPCQAMGGASYIRDLRGPFDHIPLVAVGGVDQENIGEYFQAGAQAIGVSSALFGRQALADQNIAMLSQNVKKFISSCPKNESGT